ncbi:MAG: tetratricopeptide repeat protein [Chloroflexi bacterium]|nr:tetratricopeptide repeat protein [Chloroflexota bacterium]
MSRLAMHFFGQFQVTQDGRPSSGWRYDKVRALLVYLACEAQRSHSRDELAAMLWPDSSNTAARKSLRQALTILRVVIGDDLASPPYLLITRETLQFNPNSDYSLDVAEFSARTRQFETHAHADLAGCPDCLAGLKTAVSHYQGDLLAGFSLPESVPFEEWLIFTRERLRLQAIEALGELAAAFAQLGSDDLAVHTARHQLALDPWNEEAARLLMRTLARRGQRTAALAEYERCKRILASDLGIEPSPETTAVYQQIRGERLAAPPPEPVPPVNAVLPMPLTHFVGREREITAVQAFLRRDDVRLLTVLGPPGIGKSRLAIQAAQKLLDFFQGQVYFVALAGISDPALVMGAIAETLGVPGGSRSPATLLRLKRELQNKRALLVLDNFEQLLSAATAVLDLLQTCPQLNILVTSRAPLRLRGEQRYVLPPLPLPDLTSAPELMTLAQNPAVALFVERTQAILPEFELTPENATAVAAICRRVDGLPLGIELAAARVRLLPPPMLLNQLNDASGKALRLLKDGGRGATSHHQTLHQAIQWSYELLDDEARRLFARLAVFVSGFYVEAAEAVCQIGPGTVDQLEGIETLYDNNLLVGGETAVHEIRFTMLQTIREYALERLTLNGESNLLRGRHADYFLSLAKVAATEIPGPNQALWLNRLDQEQDNMRAALEWDIDQSPEQGLELTLALFPFWHTRAYLREGRLWLERALAVNTAVTVSRARALAAASLLAQRQGDYAQAGHLAKESVALSRQLGSTQALAYALNNLGIVAMSLGDNTAARQLAEESLALSQTLASDLGVSRALMIIGQVALHEDRLTAAQTALGDSLAFWEQVGDQKNAILCLVNLARTKMLQGDYKQATRLIQDGLMRSRQVGDRQWEMMAQWTLGEICFQEGTHEQSNALFESCLVQARDIGDRYFEALSLSKLGLLGLYRQEWAAAERVLQHSLRLAEQINARWCIADARSNLGLAALWQSRLAEAEALLLDSLGLFAEQGDRANMIVTLERLAGTAVAQSQPEQAAQLLGTTAAHRAALENPLPPNEKPYHDHLLAAVQSQLGESAFAAAWAAGERVSLATAVQNQRLPHRLI